MPERAPDFVYGERLEYGRSDKTFAGNVSKTLAMRTGAAHTAFVQPEKRRCWLQEGFTIRKATPPKSVRTTWADGIHANVQITAKGESECAAAAEHSELPNPDAAAKKKAYRKSAL